MAISGSGALREFTILRGDQPRTGPKWNFPDSELVALVTGQQTEGKLAVFEQTMAANGGVPLHINHREDESFYLVEGKYLFEVGGVLDELGPASHILFLAEFHTASGVRKAVGCSSYASRPGSSRPSLS